MTVQMQPGLRALPAFAPAPLALSDSDHAPDLMRLNSNENPLGPSPRVVAALTAALQRLNFYPDPEARRLRRAIATRLGVNPEQVKVGNGADGLIREISEAYVGEEDEVIVASASFPNYDVGALLMRGRVVKTPLRNYGLDLDAMLDAITPRTKIIYVCNPNNPTGTIISQGELDAFMAQVPDRVLIVIDEAYFEFADAREFPDALAYLRAGRNNVIVLRTFSKVYGVAGVRIGYAIGNPPALGPVWIATDSYPVNVLAQEAGCAALEDREFLERTVRSNREGRVYLYGEFDRLGLTYLPSQTNFVMVCVGPQAAAVRAALAAAGILVRGCGGYGLDDWLRVTVGRPEQNRRFVAALEEALGSLA